TFARCGGDHAATSPCTLSRPLGMSGQVLTRSVAPRQFLPKPLLHDDQVVPQMTGGEPRQRPDAQAVPFGRTAAIPTFRLDPLQQQEVHLPQLIQLTDKFAKVAQAKAAVGV